MTTAATDTFTQTRDEIIADALANVGAIGPGAVMTANNAKLFVHAARALNRVVKSIDADGGFLWRIERRTILLTAGVAQYPLGTDTIAIDEPANYISGGISGTSRTQILAMSRDDYMLKPDRTVRGAPIQYLVERTLTAGVKVTFWPVPGITNDQVEYAAVLRAKDFVVGSDTPDFNSKWIVALVYGLTAEIAPSYGQEAGEWQAKFETERLRQLNADGEGGNATLVPFGNGSGWSSGWGNW